MSRTVKDKKVKHRKDKTWNTLMFGFQDWSTQEYWQNRYINPVFWTFPKLKRKQDFKDHWMSTPSDWTRLMMNRPMRRKLVQKLKMFDLLTLDEDLQELLDEFYEEEGYSKKPHQYYW